MKCPICDKEFSPDEQNAAMPFCSMRCKMIDAKRWLGEEYTVDSVTPADLEDEIEFWEKAQIQDRD